MNGIWYGLLGGLSGFVCWIPIYPADLLKSNRQLYGISYQEIHQKIITKDKNYFNYYKGFSTAIMRAVPLHGGVFIGYETIKKLIGDN